MLRSQQPRTRTLPGKANQLRTSIINQELDDERWTPLRGASKQRQLIPEGYPGEMAAIHFQAALPSTLNNSVHFHDLKFQLLYVRRGSITMAYESQGPSLDLVEGDCVLQPPHQRHAVIDSSGDLELIEFYGPRNHRIEEDSDLILPSSQIDPARLFAGQRFELRRKRNDDWQPWQTIGCLHRPMGFNVASQGLVDAEVVRMHDAMQIQMKTAQAAFSFFFVLAGSFQLSIAGAQSNQSLRINDSFLIAPQSQLSIAQISEDAEILVITTPSCA